MSTDLFKVTKAVNKEPAPEPSFLHSSSHPGQLPSSQHVPSTQEDIVTGEGTGEIALPPLHSLPLVSPSPLVCELGFGMFNGLDLTSLPLALPHLKKKKP